MKAQLICGYPPGCDAPATHMAQIMVVGTAAEMGIDDEDGILAKIIGKNLLTCEVHMAACSEHREELREYLERMGATTLSQGMQTMLGPIPVSVTYN